MPVINFPTNAEAANEMLQDTIREQNTAISNLSGQVARLSNENQKLKAVIESLFAREKLGDQILAEVMRHEQEIWTLHKGKLFTLFQLRENDLETVYAECVSYFREIGKIVFNTPDEEVN